MKRDEVTQEILDKARSLQASGEKAKAVQIATGLDHSQEAYLRYLTKYNPDGDVLVEFTPENVAALYDHYDVSVGGIMCLTGTAEDGLWAHSPSAIDKKYQEHTGYTLKGKRCGKGGAPLQGDMNLYRGKLRAYGTELHPQEVRDADARYSASSRKLALSEAMAMEAPQLREDLDACGITHAKNSSKAQLAMKWADFKAYTEAA